MARQIIVLENQNPNRGPNDPISYRYAFWLAVPAARQPFFANATSKSQVVGLSAGELTAIQNGSIVEQIDSFSAAPGSTLAQMEASLATAYAAAQTALNAATANKWDHYGTTWDGTTWAIVTVG